MASVSPSLYKYILSGKLTPLLEEKTEKLLEINDKPIIDFVRINEELMKKDNYQGINWSNISSEKIHHVSKEDTVLI